MTGYKKKQPKDIFDTNKNIYNVKKKNSDAPAYALTITSNEINT